MAWNAHDDRDALYGPLVDHFLRIGDTQFFVPPTAISVHRTMKTNRVTLLRARNSIPRESGYFDRIINITLFFPSRDSLNYELRPLLAQIKKCPFLPISNTHLNDVHKVDAITVSDVQVQTTPGYPDTLTAVIQCYAFEAGAYIYGTTDRTFDEMFNWPLFRWYYSRNLEPSNEKRTLTFYEPITEELNDGYMFRIADEEDLKKMKAWREKKRKLIKDWMEDKKDKPGLDFEDFLVINRDKNDQREFDFELDELSKNAMFEYDLHYETMDMGDLFLQDFSISFQNSITSQQLQMHESPTHQYLGSQDTILVAKFRTDDAEALQKLEAMIRRTTYLTREYHKEVANGFLQFDHQIGRLFGVQNVVINDMTTNNVPGVPGVFDISLTMTAYNRVERKMNEVQALTLDIDWKIGMFEDSNLFFGSPLWALNQPLLKKMESEIIKIVSGSDFEMGRDAHQQAIYDAAVLETFKMVELYPDLELPTYEDVAEAGFSIINMNDGIFVDPDFFIIYDEPRDFAMVLDQVLSQSPQNGIELRDAMGGILTIDESGANLNDKAKESQKQKAKEKAAPELGLEFDKKNYSPEEMEALIRKTAQEEGLPQSMPVAFVKSMDKNMFHFYKNGANPNLGSIHSSVNNLPVRMSPQMEYVKQDGEVYIGVMRNLKTNGIPVYLENNIQYNVEQGMHYMKLFWDETNATVMNSKNVDRFKELLDLNSGMRDNEETVHFIATLFLYMGFRRELNEFIGKGKQPPANLTKFMKNVVRQYEATLNWTDFQINNKYDQLPVKDYKNMNLKDPVLESLKDLDKQTEKSFKDTKEIQKSYLHDTLKYDRRGRLVRAFPTFFMTFIDEGQYIGSVKMSDQYFHYKAVSDITYTNSRKEAAGTMVCEMSNVFGSLSDADKAMDLTYTSFGDVMQSIFMPGAVAKETERSRHRDPNYYKSIMLRTGVRVHMRMGYGSNPLNMPTVLNGTVTGLQNNTETITMVVQGDGIELTNKLNAHLDVEPDDETSGFLSTGKDPTEIVDELLTDSKGLFKNMSALLSNKEFERHSLGIMHFGEKGGPQGWTDFMNVLSLGVADNREVSEINLNVYRTNGFLNVEQDTWWDAMKNAFGIGEKEEDEININLFDKTVWDVLNISAAIGSDFITAVHPFGLRSTIFLGKPYFPIHYDYKVEGDKVTGTRVKSFKQFHYYDSYMSILDNQIKTSEENIYNVAVGTFMNEGKTDVTPAIYVDTDIWPEKQKTVNIDTTLNAKGVWLADNLPVVGGFLNAPFKWFYDKGVAIKITAAGLRDYMKDMYDGWLTVMGDPSVKPYDTMVIADIYNDMNGPCDVKEVVHIMNHDVGFISMIKPDAIVYNRDSQIYASAVGAIGWLGAAYMTMLMRVFLKTRGYAGNLPILNALWASTSKNFRRMKSGFNNNRFTQKGKNMFKQRFGGLAEIAAARDNTISIDFKNKKKAENKMRLLGGTPDEDIKRWKLSGLYDDVMKALDDADSKDIENLLKKGDDFMYRNKVLKYDKIDRMKMRRIQVKTSTILMKGTKAASKTMSGGKMLGMIAKGIWKGKHALLGPVGIITFIAETAVTHVITATVGEWLERSLLQRQACIVVPLKKDKIPLLALMNGHKGSVVGDSPDAIQFAAQYVFPGLLASFGVDPTQFSTPGDYDPFSVEKKDGHNQTEEKSGNSVKAILDQVRAVPKDDGKIKEDYERDRDAAEKEAQGYIDHYNAIAERNVKADYGELENQRREDEGLFDKIGDWLKGLGDDNEGGSGCGEDVVLDGKAVNITKQVKDYEPLITKYAKQFGVAGYVQILMAKMNQESHGKGNDPMQASESKCGRIGCITNPEESIEQGVKYFAGIIKECNGDVKLALQSYNFGKGFINYVKSRGGKYTPELAWSFAEQQVKKYGRISRIPPGYGDSKYVERVLQYYKGSVTACPPGGTSDAPEVTGKAGKNKYHLSMSEARSQLIDAKNQKDRAFGISIVGGSSTSLMRKGTYELTNSLAKAYKDRTGQKFNVTSAYRTGDPNWHGTGYGVDIDTPNTMRTLRGGKLGFPDGRDKSNAKILCDLAVSLGFDGIVFGDYYILEELKKKKKGLVTLYAPSDHHNHLHLSYPTKKK
jgi:hypothetical protein